MVVDELVKIKEKIAEAPAIVILSHTRPDGDAYGSTLGLALSLRAAGKTVFAYNQDGMEPSFAYLPGSETLSQTPTVPPPDDHLLIVVDTADISRLGDRFTPWNRTPDINIDHHISNPKFAAMNVVVPHLPATAQVLFELLPKLGLPITTDVASNLYVGLMTDTGSFRFRQTSADTFRAAAELVDAGADPHGLAQSCYQSSGISRLLLLGEVLQAIRFAENNRIAWFVITQEMYDRSGASRSETEGLIDHLQSLGTVEVAFVLEPMSDGVIRASLRSRGYVDVQQICTEFGGGGHRLAAGLRVKAATPEELERSLVARITLDLPEPAQC